MKGVVRVLSLLVVFTFGRAALGHAKALASRWAFVWVSSSTASPSGW